MCVSNIFISTAYKYIQHTVYYPLGDQPSRSPSGLPETPLSAEPTGVPRHIRARHFVPPVIPFTICIYIAFIYIYMYGSRSLQVFAQGFIYHFLPVVTMRSHAFCSECPYKRSSSQSSAHGWVRYVDPHLSSALFSFFLFLFFLQHFLFSFLSLFFTFSFYSFFFIFQLFLSFFFNFCILYI